jgi:hypothetical protein
VHYCVDVLKEVPQTFVISYFAVNNRKFIYKSSMTSTKVVINHWDIATFAQPQSNVRSYVSCSTYQKNSQEDLESAFIARLP